MKLTRDDISRRSESLCLKYNKNGSKKNDDIIYLIKQNYLQEHKKDDKILKLKFVSSKFKSQLCSCERSKVLKYVDLKLLEPAIIHKKCKSINKLRGTSTILLKQAKNLISKSVLPKNPNEFCDCCSGDMCHSVVYRCAPRRSRHPDNERHRRTELRARPHTKHVGSDSYSNTIKSSEDLRKLKTVKNLQFERSEPTFKARKSTCKIKLSKVKRSKIDEFKSSSGCKFSKILHFANNMKQKTTNNMKNNTLNNSAKKTRAKLFFSNPYFRSSFHTWNLQVYNTDKNGSKLKPYECEPGICIPGQCDPTQCKIRIMKRLMNNTDTKTKNSSSETVQLNAQSPTRPDNKKKGKYHASSAQDNEGLKYKIAPKQKAKTDSNHNFDKKGLFCYNTYQTSSDGRTYTTASSSTGTKSDKNSKGRPIKNKQLTNSVSKSVSTLTQEKSNKINKNERCFCTLKLQKQAKKEKSKKKENSLIETATTGQNTDKIKTSHLSKLMPNECEPLSCIPGQCDPYKCLEIIKLRNKKRQNVDFAAGKNSKYSSASSITASTNKAINTKDIKKKGQKKTPFNGPENIPKSINQKGKQTPSKVKRINSKDIQKKAQKKTKLPQRDINATGEQVRLKRYGSSLNINLEFYKSTTNENSSSNPSSLNESSLVRAKTKGVHNMPRLNQTSQVDTNKNKHIKSKPKAKPALKRCFCTLALNKAKQTGKVVKTSSPTNTEMKSVGTKSPYTKVLKKTEDTSSNTKPYKLKPFECKPQICIPGQCDPYECVKLFKKERLQESGTSTTNYGVKSVSTEARKGKKNKKEHIPNKNNTPSRSTTKKDTLLKKISANHNRRNRNKQYVRYGSNISFNIEFYKKECLTNNRQNYLDSNRYEKNVEKQAKEQLRPTNDKIIRKDATKKQKDTNSQPNLLRDLTQQSKQETNSKAADSAKAQKYKNNKQQTNKVEPEKILKNISVAAKGDCRDYSKMYKETGTKTNKKYALDSYEHTNQVPLNSLGTGSKKYPKKSKYSSTSEHELHTGKALPPMDKKKGKSYGPISEETRRAERSPKHEQSCRMGSNINVNIEFYKKKTIRNDFLNLQSNSITKVKEKTVQKNKKETKSKKYTNTQNKPIESQVQAKVPTKDKAFAVGKTLKRCFCTAKLFPMQGDPKEQCITVGRVDKVHAMTPFKLQPHCPKCQYEIEPCTRLLKTADTQLNEKQLGRTIICQTPHKLKHKATKYVKDDKPDDERKATAVINISGQNLNKNISVLYDRNLAAGTTIITVGNPDVDCEIDNNTLRDFGKGNGKLPASSFSRLKRKCLENGLLCLGAKKNKSTKENLKININHDDKTTQEYAMGSDNAKIKRKSIKKIQRTVEDPNPQLESQGKKNIASADITKKKSKKIKNSQIIPGDLTKQPSITSKVKNADKRRKTVQAVKTNNTDDVETILPYAPKKFKKHKSGTLLKSQKHGKKNKTFCTCSFSPKQEIILNKESHDAKISKKKIVFCKCLPKTGKKNINNLDKDKNITDTKQEVTAKKAKVDCTCSVKKSDKSGKDIVKDKNIKDTNEKVPVKQIPKQSAFKNIICKCKAMFSNKGDKPKEELATVAKKIDTSPEKTKKFHLKNSLSERKSKKLISKPKTSKSLKETDIKTLTHKKEKTSTKKQKKNKYSPMQGGDTEKHTLANAIDENIIMAQEFKKKASKYMKLAKVFIDDKHIKEHLLHPPLLQPNTPDKYTLVTISGKELAKDVNILRDPKKQTVITVSGNYLNYKACKDSGTGDVARKIINKGKAVKDYSCPCGKRHKKIVSNENPLIAQDIKKAPINQFNIESRPAHGSTCDCCNCVKRRTAVKMDGIKLSVNAKNLGINPFLQSENITRNANGILPVPEALKSNIAGLVKSVLPSNDTNNYDNTNYQPRDLKQKKTKKQKKIKQCKCGSPLCIKPLKNKNKDKISKSNTKECICSIKNCKQGLDIYSKYNMMQRSMFLYKSKFMDAKDRVLNTQSFKNDTDRMKHLANEELVAMKALDERVKRYQQEDRLRRRRRAKKDRELYRNVERFKNTNDAVLLAESVFDLGKLGFTAASDIIRSACRIVTDPRNTCRNLKTMVTNPVKACGSCKEAIMDSGVISTLQRIKLRLSHMGRVKEIQELLEDNPVAGYLIHAADKNPKKRLKKRKFKKEKREPIDPCNLYMASLRKRPFISIYYMCPWFYPHCISLLNAWRQIIDIFLFMLAVIVWSPCILAMECCRALMCCTLCTE